MKSGSGGDGWCPGDLLGEYEDLRMVWFPLLPSIAYLGPLYMICIDEWASVARLPIASLFGYPRELLS